MQAVICTVVERHSREAEATAHVKLGSFDVTPTARLCCNATADAFLLWEPNGPAQAVRKGLNFPPPPLALFYSMLYISTAVEIYKRGGVVCLPNAVNGSIKWLISYTYDFLSLPLVRERY